MAGLPVPTLLPYPECSFITREWKYKSHHINSPLNDSQWFLSAFKIKFKHHMTASEALYAQTFIYPYNLTHPHLPVSSRMHCTPDISFLPLLGMLLIVFFFCTSGNLYKPQPDMSFLSKPYDFVYYCIIQCNIPWLIVCVHFSPPNGMYPPWG